MAEQMRSLRQARESVVNAKPDMTAFSSAGVPRAHVARACVQVFFKRWRHMDAAERPRPVMVHINYHPDKGERMRSIIDYFDTGNAASIMAWPGGSEKGT